MFLLFKILFLSFTFHLFFSLVCYFCLHFLLLFFTFFHFFSFFFSLLFFAFFTILSLFFTFCYFFFTFCYFYSLFVTFFHLNIHFLRTFCFMFQGWWNTIPWERPVIYHYQKNLKQNRAVSILNIMMTNAFCGPS